MQRRIAPGLAYYKSGIGGFNQKFWHTRANFLTKGIVTVALKNYTHGERLCDSAIIIMCRYVLLIFIGIQVHLNKRNAFHLVSAKQTEANTANERRNSKIRLTLRLLKYEW